MGQLVTNSHTNPGDLAFEGDAVLFAEVPYRWGERFGGLGCSSDDMTGLRMLSCWRPPGDAIKCIVHSCSR